MRELNRIKPVQHAICKNQLHQMNKEILLISSNKRLSKMQMMKQSAVKYKYC